MYGVAELLAAVDVHGIQTQAGIHLAVVRALAPVFLDRGFGTGDAAGATGLIEAERA